MRWHRSSLIAVGILAAATGRSLHAQFSREWTEPFHVAGNLYYVGGKDLASYLITTPAGHILINSDLEAHVPLIKASVAKLGFRFTDIKILLISHAHFDHDAGSAAIKALTGARYMVMDGDVPIVESGGRSDFFFGSDSTLWYPATKVDRVLHDGDKVELGGMILVAHLTPGHTKGCTTWTFVVTESGRAYNVVVVGGPNVVGGYTLVGNAKYPAIAADYERGFRVLRALPVDIFLGAHGSYFDLEAKSARIAAGTPSPFIDRQGYAAFVADREQAFQTELERQQAAARK